MRISTNTIYQSGISKISQLITEQSRLQQQISTGRRILTPSDDPVAAARAVGLTQAQNVNSQYVENRQAALTQLGTVESTLASVTELLTSTKASLVAAGNTVLSDTQRGYIAAELRNNLDQLISLANSKDGAGNYLFSGYLTKTQPFVKTATGANYQGDTGQRSIQVANDRQMAVSDTGSNVFQAGGNDIFQKLTDVITLLETPVATPADVAALTAGVGAASTSIGGSIDNVLTIRASIGSKLKELDALEVAGADRHLQYAQSLSELQDLDYAKALSDLARKQTILEAAQQSFVKTTSLSLFNFI